MEVLSKLEKGIVQNQNKDANGIRYIFFLLILV